jgi:hypothetical protein
MTREPWNRCDECGKFISYEDFSSKQARVSYLQPSSEFGDEEIEILCAKCAGKDRHESIRY